MFRMAALTFSFFVTVLASAAPPANVLVKELDVPKLKPRITFQLPGKRFQDGAGFLSADGSMLAVGVVGAGEKTPSTVQVWNLGGKAPKAQSAFTGGLYSFALSPNGKRLLTSEKREVYDTVSKKVVAKLSRDFSHAFFFDDNTVVTTKRSYNFGGGPGRGEINIWNLTKKTGPEATIPLLDDRFNRMLPAKKGTECWLFLSAEKFEIECYDIKTKKLARTIKPEQIAGEKPFRDSGVYDAVRSDGDTFTSTHGYGTVIHDADGKLAGQLPQDIWGRDFALLSGRALHAALPGRDGAKLLGLQGNEWVLYDWKANKVVAMLTGHAAGQTEPTPTVSADGKVLVSIGKEGEGLVFDLSALDGK